MKKLIAPAAAVVLALALFFAGRFTAAPGTDLQEYISKKKYDSITVLQRKTAELRDQAEAREAFYKSESEKSLREAIRAESEKKLSQIQYEKDINLIRRFRPDQRDSMLLARYRKALR